MECKKSLVALYTILHFLVDFTTVFLVVNTLLGTPIAIVDRGAVVIVYNLVAFAGQLPIGMIADVVNKNKLFVMLGCFFAGISYPIAFISPWTACVLASLGNGAFHIGAGVDILKMSMPKAGLSGLFVSSGALGVWLAYLLNTSVMIYVCPPIMSVAIILVYKASKKYNSEEETVNIRYNKPGLSVVLGISCFTLTVIIRSLLGNVMNFSWKSVPILSFLCVLSVMGGKALGGFLSDKIGSLKTAVISLTVASVTFILSLDSWILGIIGVFCFNMTMPLTLTGIADMCNKKYGFAFGLTTFALAVGFIPVVFGANKWFTAPFLVGGGVISLILLYLGFYCKQKNS